MAGVIFDAIDTPGRIVVPIYYSRYRRIGIHCIIHPREHQRRTVVRLSRGNLFGHPYTAADMLHVVRHFIDQLRMRRQAPLSGKRIEKQLCDNGHRHREYAYRYQHFDKGKPFVCLTIYFGFLGRLLHFRSVSPGGETFLPKETFLNNIYILPARFVTDSEFLTEQYLRCNNSYIKNIATEEIRKIEQRCGHGMDII